MIAFVSERDGNTEIYVMNADGSEETRLTHHALADWDPAWSPDGTKIAFTGLSPWAGPSTPHSPPRSGIGDIYVTSPNGSAPRRLTKDGHSERPQWSPDGGKIAFSSRRDGNQEIYVMSADGSGQTNLTNHPADDSHAAWSPDGTKIAFSSRRNGNQEIYVMGADGSGRTNLTNHPADDSHPAWSPDGTKIAFTRRPDHRNADLYVMDADGSQQTNLSNSQGGEAGEAAWSPDGSRIAFVMDTFAGGISVINADGSGYGRLTVRGWVPAWSPDGRHIAFASFLSGAWDIHLVNADTSREANVTRTPGDDYAAAWLPTHAQPVARLSRSLGRGSGQ
jgi:Tol biopolymer transport system component